MARLDVEIQTQAERVLLLLHGELDMATETQLRDVATQQLNAHEPAKLQLDLADVTFLDSTGVSALVDLRKEATDRGVDIEIVAASRRATRVLTIVGLAEHFGLRPDPETGPPGS